VFARFSAMAAGGANGTDDGTGDGTARPRPITLLVSHRFSTVRMADLIVVLHGGRIEELGSHDELLAAGGRYATLFHLQASRY
jgi:ATP-binding cassette subfamily B protein